MQRWLTSPRWREIHLLRTGEYWASKVLTNKVPCRAQCGSRTEEEAAIFMEAFFMAALLERAALFVIRVAVAVIPTHLWARFLS